MKQLILAALMALAWLGHSSALAAGPSNVPRTIADVVAASSEKYDLMVAVSKIKATDADGNDQVLFEEQTAFPVSITAITDLSRFSQPTNLHRAGTYTNVRVELDDAVFLKGPGGRSLKTTLSAMGAPHELKLDGTVEVAFNRIKGANLTLNPEQLNHPLPRGFITSIKHM